MAFGGPDFEEVKAGGQADGGQVERLVGPGASLGMVDRPAIRGSEGPGHSLGGGRTGPVEGAAGRIGGHPERSRCGGRRRAGGTGAVGPGRAAADFVVETR